jgi:hypothetical protein
MRLGAVWVPVPSAYYRAIHPLTSMMQRGHDVVWPVEADGNSNARQLADCEVVHIFRRSDPEAQAMVKTLLRGGVAITYDNDDNLSAAPKESADYKQLGGLRGHGAFVGSVKVARVAEVVTTTNETLADMYRDAGIESVEVIPNLLWPDADRSRKRHDGIVIGWIAGGEHAADAARLPIRQALEQLLAKHESLRVECIGVDLRLSERYRHDEFVAFEELPGRIGGFDVGIAPLSDIALNRTRSDIKVKEYAASGVPWLASPFGPYVGLGEEQGGRLVADDAWFEELERLVTNRRLRRRLSRRAAAWAKGQTLDTASDRWESLFERAKGSSQHGGKVRA